MTAKDIQRQATTAIRKATSEHDLEEIRVKFLGRRSELTQLLRLVADLPAPQRARAGEEANKARQAVEKALQEARTTLLEKHWGQNPHLDLSQPMPVKLGHNHPISLMMEEVVRLFWQMGFQVVEGPEVETPYYNFDALNIPPEHPARDMQDTFYLTNGSLPRTHTSNMQIRFMENTKPPVRIISPGKVYRNEDEDATHLWMFHQVEGLVVDQGISLADLKGTLLYMMKGLLGEDTEIRLRQSFFPYTEPSVEVDATCSVCRGKGCHTCSQSGWLELLGAGMVHPRVLRNVNIDPEVYQGFAFGVGVERLAAIKYRVPDIRAFWRPDLRFLEQF